MTRSVAALALLCGLFIGASSAPAQKDRDSGKPPDERPLRFDVRSPLPGEKPSPEKQAEAASKQASVTARLADAYPDAKALFQADGGLKFLAAPPAARLSEPAEGETAVVALAFLRTNAALFSIGPGDIDSLRETNRTAVAGLTQLTFQQVLGGRPVWGGSARVAVDSVGRVVQAEVGDLIAGGAVSGAATLDAAEAAAVGWQAAAGAASADALTALEPSPSGRLRFENPEDGAPLIVEPVIFPRAPAAGLPAFRIFVSSAAGSFEILVSAVDGELLYRAGRTAEVGSGRIYREHPGRSNSEIVAFGAGWLPEDATVTMGNFADSFLDEIGDGRPDPINSNGLVNGRASSESQTFDFPYTDDEFPDLGTAAAAVTNAFYFANLAHDYFYDLGFTETDGNFQTSNGDKGGVGGDAVTLSVRSLTAFLNAFNVTGPDGEPSSIDLGIFFPQTGGFRESAVDGDVVMHEYVHGVSTRLVGGPETVSCLFDPQPAAVAEAISDYFAISLYDDPVMAEYVTGDVERGIRRDSYRNYPRTLRHVGDTYSEEHDDGEILAAALWDARTALGAEVMDQLVVDGLKLAPCSPTFLDLRDSILTAAGTQHSGAIWEAFAARGMGHTARILTDIVFAPLLFDAAFDKPGGGNAPPRVTSQPLDGGELGADWSYRIRTLDLEGDAVTIEMLDAPPGATFSAETSVVSWRANITGDRFTFLIKDAAGNEVYHGFYLRSFGVLDLGRAVTVGGHRDGFGNALFLVPENTRALQVRMRGGEGDPDLTIFPASGPGAVFSRNRGTQETITIDRPAAGVWIAQVLGFDDFAGVTLVAESPQIRNLTPGSLQRDLSDVKSSERIFRINVPAETPLLRVTTLNGTGDVDLALGLDVIPTCMGLLGEMCEQRQTSAFDGNFEQIVVRNPEAGEWFLTVQGFDDYGKVTLRADFTEPAIKVSAGTNAGSFEEVLAPLGLGSVFGENLTQGEFGATTLPLPTELGGLQLLINRLPAPLIYVNGNQANFQTPGLLLVDAVFGLPAEIIALTADDASLIHTTALAIDAPGLFTFFLGDGSVAPVIIHADGSVVTPENPAQPGETLIAFMTGVGFLDNEPDTGEASPSSPLSTAVAAASATVGGSASQVVFLGMTPGFVGLIQGNFVVSPQAQGGPQELIFTLTHDAKLGLEPVMTPPVTLFIAE